jgi:hypothetical protein
VKAFGCQPQVQYRPWNPRFSRIATRSAAHAAALIAIGGAPILIGTSSRAIQLGRHNYAAPHFPWNPGGASGSITVMRITTFNEMYLAELRELANAESQLGQS